MKLLRLLLITLCLAPALFGAASVTLADFSSVVGAGTTFYGTWEATGSASGTGSPNSQFLQGVGVFAVSGSSPNLPTNAATSGLRFDYGSPINIGAGNQMAVTAQLLPGNAAGSFSVTLFANGNQSAVAVFPTSSFSSGSYSTVTATLSFSGGFNATQVDAIFISGAQAGGTAAFDVSFDHIAVVPEPAITAIVLGAGALGWVWRRRRGVTRA